MILPVFAGPSILLTRNLLYTAVTRAKNLAVLVGAENILHQMINNDKKLFRFSGLAEKLKAVSRC